MPGTGRGPLPVAAVVPVKPLALAKSRLALPAGHRRALALAFALDTVAALAGTPAVAGVLVVTSDAEVARRVRRLGARVAADRGAGLDAAVRDGARVASSWLPGTGVAVVPGDLPCLTVDDVGGVLRAVAAGSDRGAFVPDRAGTGTTFVVHAPGTEVRTRYGAASAARHRALGLRALDDAPWGARHDIDTVDDLSAGCDHGVGPRTRAAVTAAGGVLGPRTRVGAG
ncbi:2-phospho-L-lactate guanylyltransferase [Nocardioides sp. S5]|uniref:2-phospho-L-lactate guanylyltransferase n=1 Tax=Nocardioides sp. S5 TaxID=2017486 RepID=UPI001A8C3416|nr:2-phospho-L-lactate guanylyltransferase [Nocardioides sp. S5]